MSKEALVVVDMQNDFIDGVLGTKEAVEIVPRVVKKINEAIDNGTDIWFTRDIHDNDYLDTNEGKHLPVGHCMRFSDGWKFPKEIEAFADKARGRIIEKSQFASIFLKDMLSIKYYDYAEEESKQPTFTLIGLCTDICVIANAMLLKTYLPEATIQVDASCCAGTTPEMHKKALDVMRSCQIDIINEE